MTYLPRYKLKVLASKLLGEQQRAPDGEGGEAAAATPATMTATSTVHKDAAALAPAAAAAAGHGEQGANRADEDSGTREGEGEEGVEGRPPRTVVAEPHRGATSEEGKEREEEEEEVRIVAVDLQEMAPIEGVKQIQVQTEREGNSMLNKFQIYLYTIRLPLSSHEGGFVWLRHKLKSTKDAG